MSEFEPVDFYSVTTGAKFTAKSPGEVTRLSYSRSHTRERSTAEAALFDPGAHKVAEVIDYLSKNPEQTQRVIEAEKTGQNRSSIVGSD